VNTDQYSPPTNPVKSTVLSSRKTGIRNEVTTPALSASRSAVEQVPAACAGAGGIVQEAKAWGKAPG